MTFKLIDICFLKDAGRYGVHYRTLELLFKKELDMSPPDFIHREMIHPRKIQGVKTKRIQTLEDNCRSKQNNCKEIYL